MSAAEEARLLYQLLESARDEGRLSAISAEQRWGDLRHRFDASHPELVHAELLAIFREVELTGVLVGTWIEFHWRKARSSSPRGVSPSASAASGRTST
jgi:hypothetical protein